MLRTNKPDVKNANIKFFSILQLNLRGATDVEQLKELVVRTCWDTAFARSLNMNFRRHSHLYEFS
jgi:hypothetical protein